MARSSPSSFSAGRRWGIFFSVLVSIAAIFALAVMLNYLGARYFLRFNWSAKTTQKLSPRTLGLLNSVTNDIKVILYYDKSDYLYGPVNSLLNEYHLANPKISVQTVDYRNDAGLARRIQTQYQLTSADDKDKIIFDCATNPPVVISGRLLWEFGQPRQILTDGKMEFEKKIAAFHGEEAFSAAVQNVVTPQVLKAAFLVGHGEHILDGEDDAGYWRFRNLLAQNNILTTNLALAGDTNAVPPECSLLIIAGPQVPLDARETGKIRQYLQQGGRLFLLCNNLKNNSDVRTARYGTGLETLLAEYGVETGLNYVKDQEHTSPGGLTMIADFNARHPISSPLQAYALPMVYPRSVGEAATNRQSTADPPKVTELAWTGSNATLVVGGTELPSRHQRVPVMVAVEKANTRAGLATSPQATRMVVVGDSLCLDNQILASAPENGDFAGLAVNWLLYRSQFMAGIGPRAVQDYKLVLTNSQMKNIRWIFLAVMPGGVLLLGALVWLRRRH